MNYNSFFDTYFSSGWLCYGLLLVYFAVALYLYKRFFKDKKRRVLTVLFVYLIPMLWLITNGLFNPKFFGYGKPYRVTDLKNIDGKLYVVDYLLTMGGKMSRGEACYRVHVVDPKTGEKKRRFGLGYKGKLVCVHGDTLVFAHYDDVMFFSVSNGNTLEEWTLESLPKLYPQLATGVTDLRIDEDNNRVTLSSLDGNKWMLDMVSRKISAWDDKNYETNYQPTGKLYFDKENIRKDDKEQYGSSLLRLRAKEGTDHQVVLCDGNDSLLNKNFVFVEGEFVGLNVRDHYAIVLHYETIKKTRFILTCISLDGKNKIWEIRQSTIRPDDSDEEPIQLCWPADETQELFFFGMEKEVMAVDFKTGKIIWRQIP